MQNRRTKDDNHVLVNNLYRQNSKKTMQFTMSEAEKKCYNTNDPYSQTGNPFHPAFSYCKVKRGSPVRHIGI